MDRHVADLQVLVGYAQLDEQSDDLEEDERDEGVPDDDRGARASAWTSNWCGLPLTSPAAGESRDLARLPRYTTILGSANKPTIRPPPSPAMPWV